MSWGDILVYIDGDIYIDIWKFVSLQLEILVTLFIIYNFLN